MLNLPLSVPEVITATIGNTVSGGTAGSILFVDANGNLGQDNANLYYDDANNRMGIGTAAPSSVLHVTGSVSPAVDANAAGVTFASTLV